MHLLEHGLLGCDIFCLVYSSVVFIKFIQEIDLALACIMLNPQSILLKTSYESESTRFSALLVKNHFKTG